MRIAKLDIKAMECSFKDLERYDRSYVVQNQKERTVEGDKKKARSHAHFAFSFIPSPSALFLSLRLQLDREFAL